MEVEIRKSIFRVLNSGAVEIRNVPSKVTNDEVEKLPHNKQPFLYDASGNWGPGYISIKNQVGRKKIIRPLVQQLALLVGERAVNLSFIAGNVTGGMIPGWILSEELGKPFVYIRAAGKKGGQKELITGIANNPEISKGDNGLVVEELVNFAQTTCNGAESLRHAGFKVTHAATILFYDNPEAIKSLKQHKIKMIYLFTLAQLLDVAYGTYSQEAVDDYRKFLKDPLAWQEERGLTPIEKGGTI